MSDLAFSHFEGPNHDRSVSCRPSVDSEYWGISTVWSEIDENKVRQLWRAQRDDLRTFLSEFVSVLPTTSKLCTAPSR